MTAKKKSSTVDVNNEAERFNAIVDKLIPNSEENKAIKDSFTLSQIKFFFRWEGSRDLDIEERVIDIVMRKMREIYIADNECLCKNVTETVVQQVGEYLVPFSSMMEGFGKKLDQIGDDIILMKNDIIIIKQQHKAYDQRLDDDEKQIREQRVLLNDLKEQVEFLQPEPIKELVKEIRDIRPTLIHLEETQTFLKKTQKPLNIALRILIGVTIGIIFTILVLWNHNIKKHNEELKNKTEQVITK